ncbi:ATP-binding protein [Kribbella sp. NPDC050470]|uniref:ATP-binding protein n=1 Tax=unclassified Kribbella TaxID=2644121 RepID=UPI0037B8E6E8
MSQVFGTPRYPAYTVDRKDHFGRPISVDLRTPESHSVLFTGPPGMGKSLELDRAGALAKREGWLAIRADASPEEPLEYRLSRYLTDNLDTIKKQYGRGAAKELGKIAKELAPPKRKGRQHGVEGRFGPSPFAQAVIKTQWEAGDDPQLRKTLTQLAEQLGEIAANCKPPEPVMLLVDNLDVGSERDLAVVTQLSEHLERMKRPVFLIAAGGEMAATRLMAASAGEGRIATGVTSRFDIREVGPLTDAELRPALTEPLDDARIPYQAEAIDRLIRSANGDPTRLRSLAETALPMAQQAGGVTVDVAKTATAVVNDQSRHVYQAAWNNCNDTEKDLVAKVAVHGPHGMALPSEGGLASIGRWQELDTARQNLVASGILREGGGRLAVANPGMQDWVQTRVGQSAAHLGVAPLTAPGQAAAVESARPSTTTRTYKGMSFEIKN